MVVLAAAIVVVAVIVVVVVVAFVVIHGFVTLNGVAGAFSAETQLLINKFQPCRMLSQRNTILFGRRVKADNSLQDLNARSPYSESFEQYNWVEKQRSNEIERGI